MAKFNISWLERTKKGFQEDYVKILSTMLSKARLQQTVDQNEAIFCYAWLDFSDVKVILANVVGAILQHSINFGAEELELPKSKYSKLRGCLCEIARAFRVVYGAE